MCLSLRWSARLVLMMELYAGKYVARKTFVGDFEYCQRVSMLFVRNVLSASENEECESSGKKMERMVRKTRVLTRFGRWIPSFEGYREEVPARGGCGRSYLEAMIIGAVSERVTSIDLLYFR